MTDVLATEPASLHMRDDDFRPPDATLCPTVADLDAVLGGAYGEWEEWAHRRREWSLRCRAGAR